MSGRPETFGSCNPVMQLREVDFRRSKKSSTTRHRNFIGLGVKPDYRDKPYWSAIIMRLIQGNVIEVPAAAHMTFRNRPAQLFNIAERRQFGRLST